MTGSTTTSLAHRPHNHDNASLAYFEHSSAQRVATDVFLTEAIRKQYPHLQLIVSIQATLNLLSYASAGFATAVPIEDTVNDPVYGVSLKWRQYALPARRLDSGAGAIVDMVHFGKYMYKWKGEEFILYVIHGRDGTMSYPDITNYYILAREEHKVNELLKEATIWCDQLHDEVWVYDGVYSWQKSKELWDSVQHADWENVILDEDMKKAIINDVENFFDSRETYEKLKVPWKRGIIYYGPPGNGKTISIKAMMHSLYQRGIKDSKMPVPTLYVRSLVSVGGPEYALNRIFTKARQTAPCYLVFEDLDSIVTDRVRSYFLNEVDGLKSNDGILMVGSTNHLDRLDPGISKRPSRFDRKYFFPDPDFGQRVEYAKFWQHKLKDNEDVVFPDELCEKVAGITDKFSFAYMQEAFVAALLAIAVDKGQDVNKWAGPEDQLRFAGVEDGDDDDDLDDLLLWKELKKQVKILREEMGEERAK